MSSHSVLTGKSVWMHPLAASQVSSVQLLSSWQEILAPVQRILPPLTSVHVSPLVQASLSLQGPRKTVCVQPLAKSQLSVVQKSPSVQSVTGPGKQVAMPQTSPSVHGLPSSHVPLSVTPSQSSSWPLQISVVGAQGKTQAAPSPVVSAATSPSAQTSTSAASAGATSVSAGTSTAESSTSGTSTGASAAAISLGASRVSRTAASSPFSTSAVKSTGSAKSSVHACSSDATRTKKSRMDRRKRRMLVRFRCGKPSRGVTLPKTAPECKPCMGQERECGREISYPITLGKNASEIGQ